MINSVYFGVAFVCGVLVAAQAGTNRILLNNLGSIYWTALMLYLIGFVFLALLSVFFVNQLPSVSILKSAPPWSFLGGIIVASYLLTITYLVPKIGVSSSIVLIVAGQVFGSLAIEHFGLFGVQTSRVNALKFFSGISLIVSVYFIKK